MWGYDLQHMNRLALRGLLEVLAVLFCVWMVFSLVGCSTIPPKLEPAVYYERDLRMEVNDQEFRGFGVIDHAIHYKMKLKASGDHDQLFIGTCNRNHEVEDEGGKYKYTYTPLQDIETRAECSIHITSLDLKGKHGWGFLAVEDPERYKLNAYVKCNGEEGMNGGVSMCQSKESLIQEIVFSEPVVVAPSEKCPMPSQPGSKKFRYKMPNRECAYLFRDPDSGHEHLHYTIGYEQTLMREN